jgi:hypothetical protein
MFFSPPFLFFYIKKYNHFKIKSQDFEQFLEPSSDKGKKAIKNQIFAFLSKKIKFFPGFVILKNKGYFSEK